MLNVFHKKDANDPNKIVRYRTAFLKQDSGTKIPFKYYKMDREDIREESFLKNVEMQSHQIMIRVMCNLTFTVNSKIVIDEKQYMVESVYAEQQNNCNGLFRKNIQAYTYLVLKR